MAPQTTKERNTQRRKRKEGHDNKSYDMWDLCGFEVLTLMRNPEKNQFYSFRTMENLTWNIHQIIADPRTQNKLPSDIEKTRAKRSLRRNIGKKSRRKGREVLSHRLTPESVATKDQNLPEERVTRAMPFLPDPPSFDLTISQNQWYRPFHDRGALSEATRQGGESGLNLLSSACDLAPYLQ